VDLSTDIARIAEQERRLRLARFGLDDAWRLGARLREIAAERGVHLSIEIRLARETVFYYAMPGTTPANADWIRRKRNTVELLQRSSYGVGRSYERDGRTLEQSMGVPMREFATHGGAFPLVVDGVGCIGVATVSGAPQRDDHEIVVAALAEMCGVPVEEIALD